MRKPAPLTPPSSRVYGYARVSTVDQSLDMQIAALVKAGVAREHIYSETISGAKRRPRLEALLKGLDPGDTLVVWKLDRLGRSLIDLLKKFEASVDDGKCHMCRRVPLKLNRLYRVTTCESCEDTAKASPPLTVLQRFRCWLESRF